MGKTGGRDDARRISDGLLEHLEALMADLRVAGGFVEGGWASADGDVLVTLPYGTWRAGGARGDRLVGLVRQLGRHRGHQGALAWARAWLAERDPAFERDRHAGGRSVRPAAVYSETPPPEHGWDKVVAAHPTATERWAKRGVAAPWRVAAEWEYKDASGVTWAVVARAEHPDPAVPKKFYHFAYFGHLEGWKRVYGHREVRAPTPLYNLAELAARPDAQVLLVEGEKACEAARKDFPDAVCVTWWGGANAWMYADLSPLQKRVVAVWPDNDEDGLRAGQGLYAKLLQRYTAHVGLVPVASLRLPPGWDHADPYAGGFTPALAWAEVRKATDRPGWLLEMNGRYAVAGTLGTRAAIVRLVDEVSPGPFFRPFQRWTEIDERDFRLRYLNKLTDGFDRKGNLVQLPWSDAWLQHPLRAEYGRVVFKPNVDDAGALNLFRGPEPAPDPRGPARPWTFLRYVYDIVCSKRPAEFKAVVQLLAELVQRPEVPWGRAIVLAGEKGVGKTKFGELVCDLIPAHSVIHTNYEHAMSKFNEWTSGCVVAFFDEALYAGDKKHESYLKNMITGAQLRAEGKGKGQVTLPNTMHVILAGNPERLINATHDERRYVVLGVSSARRNDRRYFIELERAWLGGEREQLLNLLCRLRLDRDERVEVPDTPELREQKAESLSDERAFLLSASERADWQTTTTPEELHHRYLEWCDRHGKMNGHVLTKIAFCKRVANILGDTYQSISVYEAGRQKRVLRLPPPDTVGKRVLPGPAGAAPVGGEAAGEAAPGEVGSTVEGRGSTQRPLPY